MAVDQGKLEELMGRVVGDVGAAMSAALVVIGDKLGLYDALHEIGPATVGELAQRTGTAERYVREWLLNQAAGGYIDYDPGTDRYSLNDEQAFALTASGAAPVLGLFQVSASMFADEPKIAERFRTGAGLSWGEHDHALFEGTERFFAPGYRASLVSSWIPALDGVEDKLDAGGRVADVGCGHGASTIIMAEAFPASELIGYDNHPLSIEVARERARQAGVDDRVTFEVAAATDYPARDLDLVCAFDCLHDMADPVGAAAQVCRSLRPDGTFLVVEPYAGDTVEENLNPVGRLFSAASTMICVPSSLADDGLALGAQAGEARLTKVLRGGGFTRVRRATETPFNLILEARP